MNWSLFTAMDMVHSGAPTLVKPYLEKTVCHDTPKQLIDSFSLFSTQLYTMRLYPPFPPTRN